MYNQPLSTHQKNQMIESLHLQEEDPEIRDWVETSIISGSTINQISQETEEYGWGERDLHNLLG